jgi:nitroimidazol reductase NimA-like FMN-containing flavoprotein (pyridoxamine 5'-phosphate oxidase superfamily)
MPKVMTREERETFLAGVHVGVLSLSAGDDRGPVTTPLWYSYEPGGSVRFVTLPESRKARLIHATGRATLCAQSEGAPYRYVTVEGPVVEIGAPDDDWRRSLHRRYLGTEVGDQVFESVKDLLGDQVIFELTPQRWTSSDYSEDFAQA